MTQQLNQLSTFFKTFEEREDAFRREVSFKLARRHAGPSVFWQDFNRITREGIVAPENGPIAYIPSNPRDCLAFGTPRQVLMAAAMTAGRTGTGLLTEVSAVARRFGVEEQLTQPIRTLSGGETVKLALAKSFVGLPACSRMVVASPFTWLSAVNRHLLEMVAAESYRLGKKLTLLALKGEGDLTPMGDHDPFLAPTPDAVSFSLSISDLRIPLSLALNPLASAACHARVENTSLQLRSPCVVVGDNGQGKSLVARALAGALAFKGGAVIEGPEKRGPASLLFQDVLTQTLLRSFKALAAGGPGTNSEVVLAIYAGMALAFKEALVVAGVEDGSCIDEPHKARHTLLDIKAVMVAARLALRPAALILDEPDWGMSRQSAIAFVSAVLTAAHRQNTPVLLISHKPWWQTMAGSRLTVSRTARRENTDQAFCIALTADEVGP